MSVAVSFIIFVTVAAQKHLPWETSAESWRDVETTTGSEGNQQQELSLDAAGQWNGHGHTGFEAARLLLFLFPNMAGRRRTACLPLPTEG